MNLSYSLRAYEEGMADGIKEGHFSLLIKLLKKKFKHIPEKYIDLLTDLENDTLISIALRIFEFETLEDLDVFLLVNKK